MLGMTFGNAKEAREAISKYAIQFGYKLKLNPNEGCPFMLWILKMEKIMV